jgi:hypothetical protein
MAPAAALLLAACLLLTALTGCGTSPDREASVTSGAQTAEPLSVRGFLNHDSKIALPQDGFAIFELHDTDPPHAVVAEQRITIGMAGNLLRVITGDSYIDMQPVVAASGMKCEAVGDPTTTLWSLERRAALTVRGKALQECVWVSSLE